jgi:hypothetical protein
MQSFEVQQELAYAGLSASAADGTARSSERKMCHKPRVYFIVQRERSAASCGAASLTRIRFYANGTLVARCSFGGITPLARPIGDEVTEYI